LSKYVNYVKNFARNPEFCHFLPFATKNAILRFKSKNYSISSKINIFFPTVSFRHFVSFSSKRNPLEPQFGAYAY